MAVDDVLAVFRLALERAAVRNAPPLCILILDWAKYYDRIPAWLVAEVFLAHGIPPGITHIVTSLFSQRRMAFRTSYGVSAEFRPRNGVSQGCPLAGLAAVLVQDSFGRALDQMIEGVKLAELSTRGRRVIQEAEEVAQLAFVDDTTMLTPHEPRVRDGIIIGAHEFPRIEAKIELWCQCTGAKLNADKTTWMMWDEGAYRTTGRDNIPDRYASNGPEIQFCGAAIKPQSRGKLLGVLFDYHDPHAHLRNQVEKAKQRLQRLMHFGYFPAETVAKIINVQIVPLFTYGAIANCYREAQGLLLEVQGLIDHAVRRAAWAPSLNESVLRLPAQLGGLATPALQDEIAMARVATWMRVMASPTRAAKILQNEMRRITHFNGEQGDLFRTPVNPAPLQRGGRPAYRDAIRATCTAFELIKDLRQLDLTIQVASPEPPLLRRPTTAMMDSCNESGIRKFFQPIVDTLANILQNGDDSSWEVFGCSDGGVNYSEGIITAGFALKITSVSGAETMIREGWRIALTGHGSPVFLSEFAELEAMEGMLYALQMVFEKLDDQIRREGVIHGACDNANVIEGTKRLLIKGEQSVASEWIHRYRRIAQLCQALPVDLRWTRGHTNGTDTFSILNRQADEECNRNYHTPSERANAMPMRWPSGVTAILRGPGIEASGAYGRAIKRSMVARALNTVLQKGAIFQQACSAANRCALRVKWFNLQPLSAPGGKRVEPQTIVEAREGPSRLAAQTLAGPSIVQDTDITNRCLDEVIEEQSMQSTTVLGVPYINTAQRAMLRRINANDWQGFPVFCHGACLKCHALVARWPHPLVCGSDAKDRLRQALVKRGSPIVAQTLDDVEKQCTSAVRGEGRPFAGFLTRAFALKHREEAPVCGHGSECINTACREAKQLHWWHHKVAILCVARWTAAEAIRYFRDARELASMAPPGTTTHYLHRVHCPEDLEHRPVEHDDQADMEEALAMGMGFSLDEA